MKKGFVFTMYIMVLLILFSSCQNKNKESCYTISERVGRKRNTIPS